MLANNYRPKRRNRKGAGIDPGTGRNGEGLEDGRSDGTRPAIRVLAAVIHREGRWLVCRRPAHKRHGGLWEFPGGKLEPGESLVDAATRELDEELGVRVTRVGDLLFSRHDDGSPFVIEFVAVEIEGEPVAREHDELRWATLAELASLALAPSDRAFVLEMGRGRPGGFRGGFRGGGRRG